MIKYFIINREVEDLINVAINDIHTRIEHEVNNITESIR